jgi:Flp pilus assembly pilin Flp
MGKFARLIRFTGTQRQRAILRLAHRAIKDERGGEVLEYALVAGLIVVGAIGVISCVGTKLLAKWNTLNSSI